MAKFGFAPLERAAQAAREKILQQSERLADAAQRQKEEDVYYRGQQVWHVALYVLGIAVMWLIYSNFDFLRSLIPMGLEALKGLLPEGAVGETVAWGIDSWPRFHEELNTQVSAAMIRLTALFVIGLMVHGIVSFLVSMASGRFLSAMENVGGEMRRRMDSIGDVQSRLQAETASGFRSLNALSNIGVEADNLINKSQGILRRNRIIKAIELLIITAVTAAAMLVTLMDLHRMIIDLGLQGRNEALLVPIVTVLTLSFYVCFAAKRLYPLFPRLGKWLLRLIVLAFGIWLNVELILVQKQGVDIITFFYLNVLPIPEDILGYIVNYAGPVILSLLEIGPAMGIIKASNPAAERKADKEGLEIPMTDGSRRIIKPAKARRMGVKAVIAPLIWIAVSAAIISFLFCTVVKDIHWLSLAVIALVLLSMFVLLSMQRLSSDQFELKYKHKGAKIQMMFFLVYLMLIFALSPGDSILIFSEEVTLQVQQEQEQQEMNDAVDEVLLTVKTSDRFSCDFSLAQEGSEEPVPEDAFGPVHVTVSVDKAQSLLQQTTHYTYTSYSELQDYSWPAEGMESYGAYTTWGYSDSNWGVSYIEPNGNWNYRDVPGGKWVQYTAYNFAQSHVEGWSDYCSFQTVNSNVKSVEDLGTEFVDGVSTTHYVVSVSPQYNYDLNEYDEYGNLITTHDTPEAFYNAVVPAAVQEHYPEEFATFMSYVDQQVNMDNIVHLWVDAEGRLLRLEMDWSFEYYRGLFQWGDAGALARVIEATEMRPITNLQVYSYDDMAIPLQLPDTEPEVIG